jgi:Fe-S cluster assembly protein SufD
MQTVFLKPSTTEITVTSDTCYVLDMTGSVDAHLKVFLSTQGIQAKIIAAYKGIKEAPIKLVVETIHDVPYTTCTTEVKGALFDDAVSSFEGRIIIKKVAQQTASYLAHDVLVLGDNTKNESRPVLEIEANDVRASHGATTGRIDALQLFYLKSRGMPEVEAKNLILLGFFNSLLAQIPDEQVRKQVLSSLDITHV